MDLEYPFCSSSFIKRIQTQTLCTETLCIILACKAGRNCFDWLLLPIVPTLFEQHFCLQVLNIGFLYLEAFNCFCFVIFWWKNIDTKAAREMLLKLKPGFYTFASKILKFEFIWTYCLTINESRFAEVDVNANLVILAVVQVTEVNNQVNFLITWIAINFFAL